MELAVMDIFSMIYRGSSKMDDITGIMPNNVLNDVQSTQTKYK